MTEKERLTRILELARIRNKILAKTSFPEFLLYINPQYQMKWFHRRIADACQRLLNGEVKNLMVFVPPQHGKEISDKTQVPTPNGWKKHGDLMAGDIVFGRNGEQVKVIATNEKVRSEYLVKFSDGTEIECHGNHEWLVYDRSLKRERQIETKQMARTKLYSGEVGHRGCHYRYRIDAGKVVQYDDREVLIDPYTLGAWLGDGCSTWAKIHIGNNDTEIIDAIPYETKEGSGNTTRVFYIHGISHKFREYHLYNNKHIPDDYIYNSVKVRKEIIAGIIDTDGSVYQKNRRVTISNSNEKIISGCVAILKSLGQNVSVCKTKPAISSSGIQGKETIYQVGFNPTTDFPTKVKRKAINRIIKPRLRAIVSIEKRDNLGFGNCIQVEGGVYLVGENFIPTHNSEIVSRCFPSFALGIDPDLKIAGCSYSSDLANSFSRSIQRILDDPSYSEIFPNTYLNGSNVRNDVRGYLRNVDIFECVNHHGFYKAIGVGGGLTGTPVDIAIIDDPVKDAEQAYSETYRNKVWEWYNSVLLTRLHNNSHQLFIMTRWHEDDLAGRILKRDAKDWEVVSIPAIKENDKDKADPRKIGEALWEEKHSLEQLQKHRQLSPTTFSALYQQNPSIQGGNIIKRGWIKTIKECDFLAKYNNEPKHFFLDTAYREKGDGNDPSGILCACMVQGNIYITKAVDVYKEMPDLLRFIPQFMQANGADGRSTLRVEPKANGISVVQMLRTIEKINVCETRVPTESKVARLMAKSPRFECGRVYIVEGDWNEHYLYELENFPKAEHDELVDVSVYALDFFFREESKVDIGRFFSF